MNNSKAKLSLSPFQRMSAQMLFAREFYYGTTLSVEDVGDILQGLNYQSDTLTRVFFPRQRFVELCPQDDGRLQFKIRTKVGGLYTELTAQGIVEHDALVGRTVVRGDVRFDPVYLAVLVIGLFFLLTWMLATIVRTGISASPFILMTLGITNLYYFFQMFRDRDTLLERLAEVVTITESVDAIQRLADNTTQTRATNTPPQTSVARQRR